MTSTFLRADRVAGAIPCAAISITVDGGLTSRADIPLSGARFLFLNFGPLCLRQDRWVATLIVMYPEAAQVGKEFPLPLHEAVVGRDESCAVRIDVESVSRRHARIYFNGDAWIVEDLQSTNGSFVNHVPVATSVLRDSDALQVGRVILKFRAEGAYEIPKRDDDDEGEGGTGAPAVLGLTKPKPRN
jgi:hypothetical protein